MSTRWICRLFDHDWHLLDDGWEICLRRDCRGKVRRRHRYAHQEAEQ